MGDVDLKSEKIGTSQGYETVAFAVVAASFAVSLLFGGAGGEYPHLAALVQIVAVCALWELAATRRLFAAIPAYPLPFLLLLLIIMLPLLQLLPLPARFWEELPGRELSAALLKQAGIWQQWRPLSFDPDATLRTWLELLPGIAMFAGTLCLPPRFRVPLGILLIAGGTVSASLGALQTTAGNGFILFGTAHGDDAPGLFVNRNHQASLLLVTMMITAAVARSFSNSRFQWHALVVGIGLILWFAAVIVATASRTGLALLPLAFLSSALILLRPRVSRIGLITILAALSVLALLASQLPRVQLVLGRFSNTTDKRYLYWEDTIRGIERHWPFGSGIGTFPAVYPTVESLDVVGSHEINNAHNDYLELLLEGGAASAALLALFFGLYLMFLFRIVRRLTQHSQAEGWSAAAWIGIFLILAHSVVDYPLRMMSIMATMGYLMAILTADLLPRRGATLLPKAGGE